MFIQKTIRVYTVIFVLGFGALALLVSSLSPAAAASNIPTNPGIITMEANGTWLVQPHIAFPGNPGTPQGSYATSAYFPTNPG